MAGTNFLRSIGGNVALSVGLLAPVLLGVGAVAVDYSILFHQRSALQQAADNAALASVKELGLSGAMEANIVELGKSYAKESYLMGRELSSAPGKLSADVQVSKTDGEVTVNLSYEWSPFLAHLLDYTTNPIKVSATAGLAGESLVCVIGLMQPERIAKSSIHLDNRAVVKADNCSVYSNSVSQYGLRADASSSLTASTICSAGGVLEFGFGSNANFKPTPLTDCPKIDDPLLSRSAPIYGGCTHNDLKITSDRELRPGVYCGGISVAGTSDITLKPGIYVIKDGPLTVADQAKFSGTGLTFYLTGENSVFDFQTNTTIDIGAAETGPTAGLLFFEDRTVPHSFDFNPFFMRRLPDDVRIHKISSNNARNLLGTLYLSKSILLVNADAPVADSSAYTAIITGRLWLQEGPILTLNADLTDTKVPVPDGLMGTEPTLRN
ncbi:MAG: TadE/TadG family type IV pilus assembly protein [Pseudomonadota bacterium]